MRVLGMGLLAVVAALVVLGGFMLGGWIVRALIAVRETRLRREAIWMPYRSVEPNGDHVVGIRRTNGDRVFGNPIIVDRFEPDVHCYVDSERLLEADGKAIYLAGQYNTTSREVTK